MSQNVRELATRTVVVSADTDTALVAANDGSTGLLGFLASSAGNVAFKNAAGVNTVKIFAVAAGGFYPVPLQSSDGITATTSGGATGTFFLSQ